MTCSHGKSLRNVRLMGAFGCKADVATTDLATRLIDLPFLPGLEVFNRWIPAPPQGGIDTLQHEIMDFDPLLEGDLPQRLIDRLRQVQT